MTQPRSEADIPDLTGTTAVVTGAGSGIGQEVARGLAAEGAMVVLAVRHIERGEAAASAIRATTPRATLEVMALDLANLSSVHRFAEAVRSRHATLDLLINSAGVASVSRQVTADGFELDLGTNHLGHFALTGLLLPPLLASPRARVVTVTSPAHRNGRIAFDDLDASTGYAAGPAYAQSKLANVLFGYELQRRLTAAGSPMISLVCNPGWAATRLSLGSPGERRAPRDRALQLMTRLFAPSAAQGAQPILYAATSPEVQAGDFIGPSGRFGVGGKPARLRSSDRSYDEDLARRLWQVSEGLTGVRFVFDGARSRVDRVLAACRIRARAERVLPVSSGRE